MKVAALSFLCMSALVAFSSAAPATKSQVYSFPLTRREGVKHHYKNLTHATSFFRTALDDKSNAEYLATVSIGTPAQTFDVVIDTGSADLWIPTTKCGSTCANPHKFNTGKSKTYAGNKGSFSIAYGEGDGVKGAYGTETVSLGGVTLTGQYFGAVTNGEEFFKQNTDGIDGIIGLGYPGLSVGKHSTFVFTAKTQGKIPSAVLGVYLGSLSGTSNGGSLTFGGVDNTHFTGSLKYVNVQQDPQAGAYDFWWVNLNGLTYGGKSAASSKSLAILDTGTSLVYLHDNIVKAFYKNIPGASANQGGMYTVPCSLKSKPVVFKFDNNVAITMNPEDLILANGDGTCIGGIVSVGDNQSTQILGDTFLRAAYIAYDGTNNRVGFAPVKH